jgi:hypothetical protein
VPLAVVKAARSCRSLPLVPARAEKCMSLHGFSRVQQAAIFAALNSMKNIEKIREKSANKGSRNGVLWSLFLTLAGAVQNTNRNQAKTTNYYLITRSRQWHR